MQVNLLTSQTLHTEAIQGGVRLDGVLLEATQQAAAELPHQGQHRE